MNETPTLEEAYRLYYRYVYVICYKFTRNMDDAEDAAQEVFLHLTKNLQNFRGESKFTTWLHRVTVNLILMKIRGPRVAWHRRLASLEELAENPDGAPALQRALACRDVNLESAVDRTVLLSAMERMPAGYRLVLELRELQGFSHEEVAELLGVSVGLSKSQVWKARDWLAHELGAPPLKKEDDLDAVLLSELEQYL